MSGFASLLSNPGKASELFGRADLERNVMTKPVPIEAAKRLTETYGGLYIGHSSDVQAVAEFALQFEAQPLPGMSQEVVAGELREIRLVDDSLEAEEFDLIRLNDRVFAPEVVEAIDMSVAESSADLDGKPLPLEALEKLRGMVDNSVGFIDTAALEDILAFFEPDRATGASVAEPGGE